MSSHRATSPTRVSTKLHRVFESGSLLFKYVPTSFIPPQPGIYPDRFNRIFPKAKCRCSLWLRSIVLPWMLAAVATFQGHSTATITHIPRRMEEPLTNGMRINSTDHGSGGSKEDHSGCKDLAQGACHSHGMLSQGAPPLCVLKAATGGTSGLPATAGHLRSAIVQNTSLPLNTF